LDEYSVEKFTENPNVAENKNCSPEAKTVCQILVDWTLTEPNVSKQAISKLCKSLNCVLLKVPCSYSGLIGQPQSNYARVCNGEYCHFPNWMESSKSLLMFHFNSCTGAVNYYLLINCDGLPFLRYSPDYKLNPILVSFVGVSMRPLCSGVYCTEQSKQEEMPHPAIFLKQFLEDIQSLLDRPLNLPAPTPMVLTMQLPQHSTCKSKHHFPYTIKSDPRERKQLHESANNSHESTMVPTKNSIVTQRQVGC